MLWVSVPYLVFIMIFAFVPQPTQAQPDSTKTRTLISLELKKVKIEIRRDEFNGTVFVSPKKEQKIKTGFWNELNVTVAPAFLSLKTEEGGRYALLVYAYFESWRFLYGTIELLVDGEPIEIKATTEPSRRVLTGIYAASVRESFRVEISQDLLFRLGDALNIKIRLRGENGTVEGELTPAHIAQFIKMREVPQLLEAQE